MSITGTPKFNSLAVATLSADFTKPTVTFSAKAAFVDTKSGVTHGYTDASSSAWSKETMQKLKDLRDSMEIDLGKLHLDGITAATRTKGLDMESGLGEHLKDGDTKVQSV